MLRIDRIKALIAEWRFSVRDERISVDNAYVMHRCADQLDALLKDPETMGNVIVENQTNHPLRVSMILEHDKPAKVIIYEPEAK